MIIAGFDVGTTTVKGVYLDAADGRVLAEASSGYPTSRPREGHVEQDPRDWLTGLATCRERLAAAAPGVTMAAIGICSQVNSHVFTDAAFAPLRPAITWQDQRCADAARQLQRRAGDDSERIFGGPFTIDASYALSRALWLRDHEPGAWEAARWLLSPKDFCVASLTGAVSTDRISPVGLVGADGEYLDDALALVDGAAARMPPLTEFDACAGTTTGALGFPAGVPVAVGTMDAWSSIYGSGVVRPGQAAEISGTSEVIAVMSAVPGAAPGIISFPPVRDRYLHAGPNQAGGDALRWVAALLGVSVEAALTAAAVAEPQPLVFLPHLAGERAPVWNADARGVFIGLTSATTCGELVRAVLEGVAHSARHLREGCEQAAGFRAERLRLSGGGAQSPLWNQIRADAHRATMELVASPMTGCIGAALMAGVAAGATDDLEAWAAKIVVPQREFAPEPAAADRFDTLHAVYRATYTALEDQFTALRAASR